MGRNKPTKKRMKVRLDNIVREYIKLRDKNKCSTCGCCKESTISKTLDWSHKISRSNLFLRWDERNSIAQCRNCHNTWGMGISKPLNDTIDNIWGVGTSEKLESFASKNPSIKGTPLETVDYRLKLESFYKKKIKAIKEGFTTPEDSKNFIWEEFTNLENL